LQRWEEVSPDDFHFALKMPQQITHQSGLIGQRAALEEFLQVVRYLKAKLGPILIQFPPSFRADRQGMLSEFLSDLPHDLRFAVEVRHQSWYTRKAEGEPVLAELLRDYGICWAATEYPGLPVQIWKTSDFAYIRWLGQNGSFAHHTQERVDRTQELVSWSALIEQNTDWFKEIFGFFNNDYAGFAPGTANRFKDIMGLTVNRFGPPVQGTLF